MSGSRPNKVALTILAGLALIGLFAVTQSGVAILAIARFGATFNQIAETNLPALIAASQLSELNQTLVATAPEIALADTQVRRQAIADQLNGRVTRLARSVADLDGAAEDQEQASKYGANSTSCSPTSKAWTNSYASASMPLTHLKRSWPAYPAWPRA